MGESKGLKEAMYRLYLRKALKLISDWARIGVYDMHIAYYPPKSMRHAGISSALGPRRHPHLNTSIIYAARPGHVADHVIAVFLYRIIGNPGSNNTRACPATGNAQAGSKESMQAC